MALSRRETATISGRRRSRVVKSSPLSAPKAMGAAIGFAAIVVVVGVFMPDVLHAMQAFLLAFFAKATILLQNLQIPQ